MKQFMFIFLLISCLLANNYNSDVNHIIVNYKGETIECLVDSMGYEYIFYTMKDSVELDSTKIKSVYYVYTDFSKIFHYSWSFKENLRKIENRTGKVYTTSGDTLSFIDIKFYRDMVAPEIYIKKNIESSSFIPMLEVEKIETDFSILSYAVKRGFVYSLSLFLISTLVEINSDWRSGTRLFPAAANQFDDLMPMIKDIGLKDAGASYESITTLIPLTIMGTMAYDVLRKKNQFYFTPVLKKHNFGRNMYVFSLRQVFKSQLKSIVYKIESTRTGRRLVVWLRKK